MCPCKSEMHVANYCKYKLSRDIEKSPGSTPMYVDPSNTIAASYSQGNELVFGQNAGQKCVAIISSVLSLNSVHFCTLLVFVLVLDTISIAFFCFN